MKVTKKDFTISGYWYRPNYGPYSENGLYLYHIYITATGQELRGPHGPVEFTSKAKASKWLGQFVKQYNSTIINPPNMDVSEHMLL